MIACVNMRGGGGGASDGERGEERDKLVLTLRPLNYWLSWRRHVFWYRDCSSVHWIRPTLGKYCKYWVTLHSRKSELMRKSRLCRYFLVSRDLLWQPLRPPLLHLLPPPPAGVLEVYQVSKSEIFQASLELISSGLHLIHNFSTSWKLANKQT